MDLLLREKTLVVYVDDTGHEALAQGHPVYGLGGCAALAEDLDRLIRHPWHDVRRQIGGSPDARLHAGSFSRRPGEREIGALAAFFRTQPFARIGAIVSQKTSRGGVPPMTVIAKVLQNRIQDIARWMPCTEVNVIFESSDRADRLIEDAFQDLRIDKGGQALPVECFFMPKAAGDAALEVADFIMQAVGRQARRRIEGREGFAPDFAAVFHGQDPKRASFMDVADVRQAARERAPAG